MGSDVSYQYSDNICSSVSNPGTVAPCICHISPTAYIGNTATHYPKQQCITQKDEKRLKLQQRTNLLQQNDTLTQRTSATFNVHPSYSGGSSSSTPPGGRCDMIWFSLLSSSGRSAVDGSPRCSGGGGSGGLDEDPPSMSSVLGGWTFDGDSARVVVGPASFPEPPAGDIVNDGGSSERGDSRCGSVGDSFVLPCCSAYLPGGSITPVRRVFTVPIFPPTLICPVRQRAVFGGAEVDGLSSTAGLETSLSVDDGPTSTIFCSLPSVGLPLLPLLLREAIGSYGTAVSSKTLRICSRRFRFRLIMYNAMRMDSMRNTNAPTRVPAMMAFLVEEVLWWDMSESAWAVQVGEGEVASAEWVPGVAALHSE